ncbi:MAG: hypothetical protein ACK5RG_12605 [Cyclobacteriaceae bacterium]|jgi:hypothetical protein|nr:hypothetical protein [Flammeovirgaceae bacterium]
MEKSLYEKIRVELFRKDWVECPTCKFLFNLKDTNQWSGLIHKRCGQRLEIAGHKNELTFIWCLVANISTDDSSRFKKGTKVYLYPPLWGDGYQSIKVIGKDRETNKFMEIIVNEKRLSAYKVVKVTKPDIISRFCNHWNNNPDSVEAMLKMADEMNRRKALRDKDNSNDK